MSGITLAALAAHAFCAVVMVTTYRFPPAVLMWRFALALWLLHLYEDVNIWTGTQP